MGGVTNDVLLDALKTNSISLTSAISTTTNGNTSIGSSIDRNNIPQVPPPARRGRPKGSCGKRPLTKTVLEIPSDTVVNEKRPVGRPLGTGLKQRAPAPQPPQPPPPLQLPVRRSKAAPDPSTSIKFGKVVSFSTVSKMQPAKKSRKRRTCRKCNQPGCSGSQTVKNCLNRCRDCGNVSCKGRNMKYPRATCQEGWEIDELRASFWDRLLSP